MSDFTVQELTLGQLLENTAARFPDTDAVIHADRELRQTWSEFSACVDDMARGLMAIGVQKGEKVAVWATNVPHWVTLMFATARIGAILVTVNTNYRETELRYLLPSRKFASSKNYRPRKAIDWATYRSRGPSYAQLIGLKGSSDPLGLSSTAVLAYDMDTNQVLYEKNADQPLPIASITKLMTALVIVESGVNLDDKFTVTREDFVPSSAHSKLRMGMEISRRQALHLALMSSDNRAAHFLARTYPTGKAQFIKEMNIKAALLGMKDSVFYDSIGLNNDNRSSAVDLSYLITGASEYALIRELSTTPEASFRIGKREVISSTTNRLIKDEDWDIELQKTGLTTAAGYCMVMQAHVDGKNVAFIFLDSPNKYARANDAEKLRSYLSRESVVASN